MNISELKKIYTFIIDNQSIVNTNGAFSKNTLNKLYQAIKNNDPKSITLTEEQKITLINAFLKNPKAFTSQTPELIVENPECLEAAIHIDLQSLAFLGYFYQVPPNLVQVITSVAKEKNYTLTSESPSILKTNYQVALNSINLDSKTADYVGYDYLWPKEIESIIEVLSQSSYTISSATPEKLLSSKKLCLSSLKNDLETVIYFSENMKATPEIFNYLLKSGYEFSDEELRNMPISILSDIEILKYYNKRFQFYNSALADEQPPQIANFQNLISSFAATKPTIESFMKIWKLRASEEWSKYRNEHPTNYMNLFAKITGELRASKNFEDIFKALPFLDIRYTIPDHYDFLINRMAEYHKIYHHKEPNYLEKLQKPAADISKIIALYIAASKEDFVKEQLNFFKWNVKPYFKLRVNHPFIKKKIIEHRRRKIFEGLYLTNNPKTNNFVDSLIEKYKEYLPVEQLRIIITAIIRGFKYLEFLKGIDKKPDYYKDYQNHQEAQKITNRLNQGSLKYESPEVEKHHDKIKFDERTGKYFVEPLNLTEEESTKIHKYETLLNLYRSLKKDIMTEIKKVDFDDYADPRILKSLAKQLPFTDEYFEFDETKITLKDLEHPYNKVETNANGSYNIVYEFSAIFTILNIFFYSESILSESKYFQIVYELFIKNGLAWLLCIEQEKIDSIPQIFKEQCLTPKKMMALLNNIPKSIELSHFFDFELLEITDFIRLNQIAKHTDVLALSILGQEVAENIYKDSDFSEEKINETIKKACYLISNMCKRQTSTVPYVSGSTLNYHYSMYSQEENELLLAGIRTNSCFQINNTDNDFLFYSALDKNGFVIKITDLRGTLIARASGFRNGNYIYLNQLRTIYDKGNNIVEGVTPSEQKEIITALKRGCEDIIRTSKSNTNDELGIDYVFITQSYILKDYQGIIIDKDLIGEQPMDNVSEDWQNFLNNTSYLLESPEKNYFETDFASYPLLCIARSSNIEESAKNLDIKKQDVQALYPRHRSKIECGNKQNKDLITKINKIAAIKSYLENTDFAFPTILEEYTLFVGDNWFLITSSGVPISSCVIEEDSFAIKELNETIKSLKEQYPTTTDSLLDASELAIEQPKQLQKTPKAN